MAIKIGSMLEKFEVNGFWWLPEHPDNKVPGKLIFDPGNSARVELQGVLTKFSQGTNPIGQITQHEYVHGQVADGSYVSLMKVLDEGMNQFTFQATSYFQSTLTSSSAAVFFLNTPPFSDELWTRAEIRISNLEKWSFDGAFSSSCNPENKLERTLTFNPPKAMFKDIDCGSFTLSTNALHSGPGSIENGIEFNYSFRFELEFKEPVGVEKIFSASQRLAALISLLTGATQLVKDIDISFLQDGKEKIDRIRARPYLIGQDSSVIRPLRPQHCLFPLEAIGDGAAKLFKTFFELQEKLEIPLSLYMAVAHQQSRNIFYCFIAFAQAIEALHFSLNGECRYMDEGDHRDFRRPLRKHYPATLEKEYIESLNEAIQQSNRFTFIKKLNDCFEMVDDELKDFLSDDFDAFTTRLKNWRNRISHGNFMPDQDEYQLFNADYFKFKIAFEAILLNVLGLDKGRIAKRLKDVYGFLMQQLQ